MRNNRLVKHQHLTQTEPFFSGLVQAPGAYRLGQGIAFHPQLLGYGGGFQTFIESFLRLIQYRIG